MTSRKESLLNVYLHSVYHWWNSGKIHNEQIVRENLKLVISRMVWWEIFSKVYTYHLCHLFSIDYRESCNEDKKALKFRNCNWIISDNEPRTVAYLQQWRVQRFFTFQLAIRKTFFKLIGTPLICIRNATAFLSKACTILTDYRIIDDRRNISCNKHMSQNLAILIQFQYITSDLQSLWRKHIYSPPSVCIYCVRPWNENVMQYNWIIQ